MSMNKSNKKNLLAYVLTLLHKCGFSLEDLAKMFNTSTQTMANWEAGKGAQFESGMKVILYSLRHGIMSFKDLDSEGPSPMFVDLEGLSEEHQNMVLEIVAALKFKDSLGLSSSEAEPKNSKK
jgi:transcriptional regulator with XRE-family HTH domain